jgi:hypothetical protein
MSTPSERQTALDKIRQLPAHIEALVVELTPDQLTTHFLPNEWTVAQNVHHLFDSHANCYVRCKLILTEDNPPLKPYDQDAWAALPDASTADIANSLALLRALHVRWVQFWQSLPSLPTDAWSRTGLHPDYGAMSLDRILQSYAAHGEAHIDQITRTLAAQPS